MQSNRVTLEQMRGMAVAEVATLPIDQLALLQEDVATLKADAKACDERLGAALERRFGEKAAAARRAQNKDTGLVRVPEGEFEVAADLPKSVVWDQKLLAKAEATVLSWGEPVEDFMTVKRTVAEAKFAAWPSSIRAVFEPARTVKAGRQSFEIVRKEAA